MKLASSFETEVPFTSWCLTVLLKLMVIDCCRSQSRNGFKRETGEVHGAKVLSWLLVDTWFGSVNP